MCEGWLLAMGYKPVPEEYGPGKPAPVEVRFLDQFWHPHIARVKLGVERSTRTRKSPLQTGSGLYERDAPPASMERVMVQDVSVPVGPPPGVDVAKERK